MAILDKSKEKQAVLAKIAKYELKLKDEAVKEATAKIEKKFYELAKKEADAANKRLMDGVKVIASKYENLPDGPIKFKKMALSKPAVNRLKDVYNKELADIEKNRVYRIEIALTKYRIGKERMINAIKAYKKQYNHLTDVEKAGKKLGKVGDWIRNAVKMTPGKQKALVAVGAAGALATGAAYARYRQLEKDRKKKGIRKESLKLWEQYFIE